MSIGQLILRIIYRIAPQRLYGRALERLRDKQQLLDIGGGMGLLEKLLGCKGYMIIVDVDPAMLSHTPRTACTEKVACDAHNLCIRPSSWNGTVVFHDSLHHLEDPTKALNEAKRVLRNGCIHVYDYKPQGLGRILVVTEKLAGFPATFMTPEEAARTLAELGLKPSIAEDGRIGYTVIACKDNN